MTGVGITGMGVFAPTGHRLKEFWASQLGSRSRIGPSERFSADGLRSTMVQELSRQELSDLAEKFDPDGRLDPFYHVAASAVAEALTMAHLNTSDLARTGLFIASSSIGWWSGEAAYRDWNKAPDGRAWHRHICRANHAAIGTAIAARFGIGGALQIVSAACASGGIAIDAAIAQIRAGRLDRVVICGADLLANVPLAGFNSLRMVSQDCCRPFSRDRNGIILAEGAAAIVFEPTDSAGGRGAKVFAQLAATSCGCDADHMTRPAAEGIARTMRRALTSANIVPAEIGLISAHGTGTKVNDSAEAVAIQEILGKAVQGVPVTAIKSSVGHMQGAAGIFAVLSATLSLVTGRIPPVANFSEPDPGTALDLVTSVPRDGQIGAAVVNAFGFGGVSSSVVLKRAPISTLAAEVQV